MNTILVSNLICALSSAIKESEKINPNSAYVAGLKSNLQALESGERLTIKYE